MRIQRFAYLLVTISSWSVSMAFLARKIPTMEGTTCFVVGENSQSNDPVIVEYNDFLPDPNPSLTPADVLSACMSTLKERQDAGLEVCWRFSSDRCRAALGGSLERFAQYATNPVFGYLVQCTDHEVLSTGPIIKGTPTRGDMQTILMQAKQTAGDNEEEHPRRFLWTFQKERRPPRQDCWVIHEVIYVKNAYALTL